MKGIPDIARHASVRVTACSDTDSFDYPQGLICAAEAGGAMGPGGQGGQGARGARIAGRDGWKVACPLAGPHP